jgi:hypothetical protein
MGKYHNKATKSVLFRFERRMIKIPIIEREGSFFVGGAHGSQSRGLYPVRIFWERKGVRTLGGSKS